MIITLNQTGVSGSDQCPTQFRSNILDLILCVDSEVCTAPGAVVRPGAPAVLATMATA